MVSARIGLLALVALFAFSATTAQAVTTERPISGTFVMDSYGGSYVCGNCGPGGTPLEIETCSWAIFLDFSPVAGAASYALTVKDNHPRVNTTTTYTGPPFPAQEAEFAAPAGKYRFGGLTGGAGAGSCTYTMADFAGRFELLKAVAIFDDKLRIAGTVKRKDGTPASGVRISASGAGAASATTDASGSYSMLVPKRGTYTVRAPKAYCAGGVRPCTPSRSISVQKGTVAVNFQQDRDVKLSGTVVRYTCSEEACSREPVSAVSISAGPGGHIATTDGSGNWELEVPKGAYTVRAAGEGMSFTPSTRHIDADGDVGRLDFETCRAEEVPVEEDLSLLGRGSWARSTWARAGGPRCAMTIDWKMPNRLYTAGARPWFGLQGLPAADMVYPNAWSAKVFMARAGNRASCGGDERYRWSFTAPASVRGAAVLRPLTPIAGCSAELLVTELGNYRVVATREVRQGGRWVRDEGVEPFRGTVRIKDWLIAGVGDSNGSGEGNPSTFSYERCNRGSASYQYQTAKIVEEQDPRTSVTFLHTACSGARIQHVVDAPYKGTRAGLGMLDPQAEQVRDLLAQSGRHARRKADAVIASVGVNDIAFGPIIQFCVKQGLRTNDACGDLRVQVKYDQYHFPASLKLDEDGVQLSMLLRSLQNNLEARYREFPASMRTLGVQPKRVFLANYPDFSHRDDGTICIGHEPNSIANFSNSTWQLFSDNSRLLNRHVIAAAGRMGMVNVPVDQSAFAMRGYCSSNSLFVGIGAAVAGSDMAGPFHPNIEAHQIAATATARLVCASLYKGDTDCDPT